MLNTCNFSNWSKIKKIYLSNKDMSAQFQVTPHLENCKSNYMSNDEEDIVVFINGQLFDSDTFFCCKIPHVTFTCSDKQNSEKGDY